MSKKLALVLAVLMLCSLFAACNKEEATTTTTQAPGTTTQATTTEAVDPEAAKYGGSLTIVLTNEPMSMNFVTGGVGADAYLRAVNYNGLTAVNEKGEIIPQLAKSWDVSDDGCVYTFHLRDDAYWHDGEKFTADDVIFSREYLASEDLDIPSSSWGAADYDYAKVDDYTVTVTLPAPDGYLLESLCYIIPEHIFKDVPSNSYYVSEEGQTPISTGPFKFVEYKVGEYVKFEAFDQYWNGRPYIDTVYLQIIEDSAAAKVAFSSGQAQLMAVTGENMRKELGDENYAWDAYPTGNMNVICFNLTDPRFQDINVRRAISHLVDRVSIIAAFGGGSEPLDSCFTPADQFYNPSVCTQYDFNIDAAIKLLDDAGWKKGASGFREKDGMVLDFSFLQFYDNACFIMMEQAFKKADMGITSQMVDSSIYFEKMDALDFELSYIGWTAGPNPYGYTFCYAEGFYSTYESPEMLDLFEKANATGDNKVKAECYDEIQRTLTDGAYLVWVDSRSQYWAHPKTLNIEDAGMCGGWQTFYALEKAYFVK